MVNGYNEVKYFENLRALFELINIMYHQAGNFAKC